MLIAALLEAGADPNIQNNELCSPLHTAVLDQRISIVRMLLEHGADAMLRFGGDDKDSTALHLATSGAVEIVELLLEHNSEINALDNYGRSPLYLAVLKGNTSVMKLLVVRGADVGLAMNLGSTPLSLAQLKGLESYLTKPDSTP